MDISIMRGPPSITGLGSMERAECCESCLGGADSTSLTEHDVRMMYPTLGSDNTFQLPIGMASGSIAWWKIMAKAANGAIAAARSAEIGAGARSCGRGARMCHNVAGPRQHQRLASVRLGDSAASDESGTEGSARHHPAQLAAHHHHPPSTTLEGRLSAYTNCSPSGCRRRPQRA